MSKSNEYQGKGMIVTLLLAVQPLYKALFEPDNDAYLDNSYLMIKVIAQKDLEYQYYNTFVVRYQHIPPLGGEILAVTIG